MRYLLPCATLCCASALSATAQQNNPRPAPRPGTTLPRAATTPRAPVSPPAPPAGGSAMGNVLKTDPARSEILITGRSRNDAPQKVIVTERTVLVKHLKGTAADLKVGETIEISGIPLQIDARTIRVGEIARRPEVKPTKPVPPEVAARADRNSRLSLSRPRMLGRVLKVNPLVVQLTEGINAEVRVSGDTSIIRVAEVPLSSVKTGEPLFALGSRDQNGALVARRVQVGQEGFPGARTGSRAAERQPNRAKK